MSEQSRSGSGQRHNRRGGLWGTAAITLGAGALAVACGSSSPSSPAASGGGNHSGDTRAKHSAPLKPGPTPTLETTPTQGASVDPSSSSITALGLRILGMWKSGATGDSSQGAGCAPPLDIKGYAWTVNLGGENAVGVCTTLDSQTDPGQVVGISGQNGSKLIYYFAYLSGNVLTGEELVGVNTNGQHYAGASAASQISKIQGLIGPSA